MSEKNATNYVANWFIAFGVAGALFLWWAASGFPGVGDVGKEIYAGDWTCYTGDQGIEMYGPSLVVADGEIVKAYHFDMSAGAEYEAPYENVNVISATKLTLDSTYGVGPEDLYSFTCEKD